MILLLLFRDAFVAASRVRSCSPQQGLIVASIFDDWKNCFEYRKKSCTYQRVSKTRHADRMIGSNGEGRIIFIHSHHHTASLPLQFWLGHLKRTAPSHTLTCMWIGTLNAPSACMYARMYWAHRPDTSCFSLSQAWSCSSQFS